MSRRNSDRVGGGSRQSSANSPAVTANQPDMAFSFVVPTEFVELPSMGKYYPEGHPLHNKDVIEIRHMTAKEEDILTSRTLLKKGVALDRLLSNIIIDKRIDPDSLLVGDRNAVIIAARISGYGEVYETKVQCPSCMAQQKHAFDISDPHVHNGGEFVREDLSVVATEDVGFFETTLPASKIKVRFKLLTGKDEKGYLSNLEDDKKKNKTERTVTRQLMRIIETVNDSPKFEHKKYVVENMPSKDSRYLRMAYRISAPNVDLIQNFECSECGHAAEMEVPLSADFFWPDT